MKKEKELRCIYFLRGKVRYITLALLCFLDKMK
jgi:hypothetical protein